MKLHRTAREVYGPLDITTTPPVTGPWEASFDDGVTWVTGEADGAGWKWLVAGPDAEPDEAATVVVGTSFPLVRHTSNPEIIVRDDVPRVTVYP